MKALATKVDASKTLQDLSREDYLQALTLVENLRRRLFAVINKELDSIGSTLAPSIVAEPIQDEEDGRAQVSLTPRQHHVLALLVEGKSNKEIARALSLGEGTVKIHIAALFRSLGVTNRAHAAVIGTRLLPELRHPVTSRPVFQPTAPLSPKSSTACPRNSFAQI